MALGAVAALKGAGKKPGRRQDRLDRRHARRGAGHPGRLDRRRHRVQPALRPAGLPGRCEDFYSGKGVAEKTIISDREYTQGQRPGRARQRLLTLTQADVQSGTGPSWRSAQRARKRRVDRPRRPEASSTGVVALDALADPPGEVHALVGENGAGKSTLIKVSPASTGRTAATVRYRGDPVAFAGPRDAQAAGICTIYQEVNLVPLMSVAAQPVPRPGAAQPVRPHRLRAGCTARPRDILARYGIDRRRAPAACGELGLGVQQMVALARAVADRRAGRHHGRADVLARTARGRHASSASIGRCCAPAAVAVLYVSHRLDELYRLCDAGHRAARRPASCTPARSPPTRPAPAGLARCSAGTSPTSARHGATTFTDAHAPPPAPNRSCAPTG